MSESEQLKLPQGRFLVRTAPSAMLSFALGSAVTIATLLCIIDGPALLPNTQEFGVHVWLIRMVGMWLSAYCLWTFGFLAMLYMVRTFTRGIELSDEGFKLWRFGKVVPWTSVKAITCEPQPFFSKAFCITPVVHRLTIYAEKPAKAGKPPKMAPHNVPSFQYSADDFQSMLVYATERCFSVQPSAADLVIAEGSTRDTLKVSYENGRKMRVVMSMVILASLLFYMGRRATVNYNYNMGNREYQREHYKVASEYYKRATMFDPTFAPGWDSLARSEYRMNDVKAAERDWLRAIQMKPDYVESKIGLATIAMKRRDYGSARRYLRSAIMLSPTNLAAYMSLADLYIREYQYIAAIDILNQVVRQDEANGRARGLLARALLRSGSLTEAEKQIAIRDHDSHNAASDRAFVALVSSEVLIAKGKVDAAEVQLSALTRPFVHGKIPDDLLLDWISLRAAQSNPKLANELIGQALKRGIPDDEIDSALRLALIKGQKS